MTYLQSCRNWLTFVAYQHQAIFFYQVSARLPDALFFCTSHLKSVGSHSDGWPGKSRLASGAGFRWRRLIQMIGSEIERNKEPTICIRCVRAHWHAMLRRVVQHLAVPSGPKGVVSSPGRCESHCALCFRDMTSELRDYFGPVPRTEHPVILICSHPHPFIIFPLIIVATHFCRAATIIHYYTIFIIFHIVWRALLHLNVHNPFPYTCTRMAQLVQQFLLSMDKGLS